MLQFVLGGAAASPWVRDNVVPWLRRKVGPQEPQEMPLRASRDPLRGMSALFEPPLALERAEPVPEKQTEEIHPGLLSSRIG